MHSRELDSKLKWKYSNGIRIMYDGIFGSNSLQRSIVLLKRTRLFVEIHCVVFLLQIRIHSEYDPDVI